MKTYRIRADHRSTCDIEIKRIGKYGLMIRPDETGGWDGCRVHQLASDKELRDALEKLGYKPDEITYAFEMLADKKSSWAGMTDLDEATVAALGF
jgi:hypothetical protein